MRITGCNRSLLLPLLDVDLVIGDLGCPDAAKQLEYQRYSRMRGNEVGINPVLNL